MTSSPYGETVVNGDVSEGLMTLPDINRPLDIIDKLQVSCGKEIVKVLRSLIYPQAYTVCHRRVNADV